MSLLKRLFSCIILSIALVIPAVSQDADLRYEELLTNHEELLNDYEVLIEDYEELLEKFNELKHDYIVLSSSFEDITYQHSLDIKFHEETKLSLVAANKVIESFEKNIKQLLSIADVRYFAIYPKIGYAGKYVSGGLSFTAQYPKFPLSLMVDVNYIHGIEFPMLTQVGLGFRF